MSSYQLSLSRIDRRDLTSERKVNPFAARRVPAIEQADPRMADERVATTLRDRLRESPYLAIRQLTCDFQEGIAILRGTVPIYHTRQIAIGLVQSVDGVEMLDDRIKVSAWGD